MFVRLRSPYSGSASGGTSIWSVILADERAAFALAEALFFFVFVDELLDVGPVFVGRFGELEADFAAVGVVVQEQVGFVFGIEHQGTVVVQQIGVLQDAFGDGDAVVAGTQRAQLDVLNHD